jgi:hypothetical protein
MTAIHVKKTKSYGRYIDSLLQESRLNNGKIEISAIGNEAASIPHSSKLLSKLLKPSDLKSILPDNIKYIEKQIASLAEGRFDRDNEEDVERLRKLLMNAWGDSGTSVTPDSQKAWKELADYIEFELNYDIPAAPWCLGTFQQVNLQAGQLPLFKTPYSDLERFTVRSMALDGTAEMAQWKSAREVSTIEMEYLSTPQVEFRDMDLQTGDVNQVDKYKTKLQHSLDMHLDALAKTNIDAALVVSGLRDMFNVETGIDSTVIPDTNYLDLTSVSYGAANTITILRIKAILLHLLKFGMLGYADEKFTISNIQVSPHNAFDHWDFTDLVSDVTDADPATTVPTPTREAIFQTGAFINAWGNKFTMTPNPQLTKGRLYVFSTQPLGWVFYKPELDKFYMWDGRLVPALAMKNRGLMQMSKAVKIYVPDLWRTRIAIVDY